MAGLAGVSRGRCPTTLLVLVHWAGGSTKGAAKAALAKPQPSCVARELALKSVLLPRTALQLRMPSSRLLPLANIPSSGLVWRSPVPKDQVAPSARPSGWHEPQLLQPSLD